MVVEPIYSQSSATRIHRRGNVIPFAHLPQPTESQHHPHTEYMSALLLTAVATTSLFTAAASSGMFAGNDEWGVISACGLGGCFGSAIGVFFAIFAKPCDWTWHIFGIRWFVNLCMSVVLGPLAYWYLFPIHFKSESPSPILALACGGAVGALGILLLQPLVPWLQRFLQNRANRFTNTKS